MLQNYLVTGRLFSSKWQDMVIIFSKKDNYMYL